MLTERIVRDAKAGPKQRILWDRQVKGLGCLLQVSGRKTYVLSYREHGRKRLVTLGRCSDFSLRGVRDFAREELARLSRGEEGLLDQRRRARQAPTINDALKRFFDETVKQRIATGRLTERTAAEYRRQAQRYVAPSLGPMRVTSAAAAGENVFVVRGLLGHKTIAMAARYVEEAGLDIRSARERAARPLEAVLGSARARARTASSDD